jgi:hypothetical protein
VGKKQAGKKNMICTLIFQNHATICKKKKAGLRLRRWTLQAFPLPRYAPRWLVFAVKF